MLQYSPKLQGAYTPTHQTFCEEPWRNHLFLPSCDNNKWVNHHKKGRKHLFASHYSPCVHMCLLFGSWLFSWQGQDWSANKIQTANLLWANLRFPNVHPCFCCQLCIFEPWLTRTFSLHPHMPLSAKPFAKKRILIMLKMCSLWQTSHSAQSNVKVNNKCLM